jgi:flagellar basal-body rod protein FlgB
MDVTRSDLTLALMSKTLGLLNARQETIAGNIANVNTPGYQRRDVDFAGTLTEALNENPSLKQNTIGSVNDAEPDILVDNSFIFRNDKGGVDIDREMAEQARTQILYSTYTRLIGNRLKLYRTIITEGRNG